jgi:hypothetical protein
MAQKDTLLGHMLDLSIQLDATTNATLNNEWPRDE